jgi:hypothetical protein
LNFLQNWVFSRKKIKKGRCEPEPTPQVIVIENSEDIAENADSLSARVPTTQAAAKGDTLSITGMIKISSKCPEPA